MSSPEPRVIETRRHQIQGVAAIRGLLAEAGDRPVPAPYPERA